MFKHHAIRRALTGGLVIAAAAFPSAAQARPALDPPATVGATHAAPARSGFQWDDAGLGAAAAVLALGGGGVLATGVRRRRTHRTVVG
ncbi:MAG TPA: hypothetical protein VF257_06630 [Solirubrobacteraceae bacterium]